MGLADLCPYFGTHVQLPPVTLFSPDPIRSMAPPSDWRTNILVSCLTYGLIVLGVRHLLKTPVKEKARPQANQTSQTVLFVDFNHLKEEAQARPYAPREAQETQGSSGVEASLSFRSRRLLPRP